MAIGDMYVYENYQIIDVYQLIKETSCYFTMKRLNKIYHEHDHVMYCYKVFHCDQNDFDDDVEILKIKKSSYKLTAYDGGQVKQKEFD